MWVDILYFGHSSVSCVIIDRIPDPGQPAAAGRQTTSFHSHNNRILSGSLCIQWPHKPVFTFSVHLYRIQVFVYTLQFTVHTFVHLKLNVWEWIINWPVIENNNNNTFATFLDIFFSWHLRRVYLCTASNVYSISPTGSAVTILFVSLWMHFVDRIYVNVLLHIVCWRTTWSV